jgi:hypothetical protein
MRHARAEDLDQLEPLLESIRAAGVLKEKKRGTFSFGPRGFLHFHQDPAGFFADVRDGPDGDYDRIKVNEPAGDAELLARIAALKG